MSVVEALALVVPAARWTRSGPTGRSLPVAAAGGFETWLDFTTGRVHHALAQRYATRREPTRGEPTRGPGAETPWEGSITMTERDDGPAGPAEGEELDLDAILAELEHGGEATNTGDGRGAHADTAGEPWRSGGTGTPPVPKLWPIVRDALAERGWQSEECAPTAALVRVCGVAANYELFVSADEAQEVVRCWVTYPVRIPEARRGAVLDLLNRANHREVGLGSFELDPEDGQPRWRHAIDVEGGLLGATMVHTVLGAGLWYCDRVWAPLMAVSAAGLAPADALRLGKEA